MSKDDIVELCALIHATESDSEGARPWRPILGLFKSAVIALTYLRRNHVQQELAEYYGVSQATVSRAITAITPRAAATAGTALGLSSFASKPIEDVVAANPKTFFQAYWLGDKDSILRRLDRAKRAGAKGLIVTLDWTFAHRRDWGSPALPERVDLKTMARFAPQVAVKPRWLWAFLRSGKLPDLGTPNLAEPGERPPTFFGAYGQWMGTPPPSWDDLAWLRQQWEGPFLLKGVMHPDDARRSVDIGALAISVSNHGGNNLDSTPASIRALPSVKAAVGEQLEVVLDGGIRRGSDVVKALALGARAVMIGRPYLWGRAANGEAGVANVLEILRGGIDSALLGAKGSNTR